MKLTVNGVERSFESASADAAPARAPRGARDHEPEGRLPARRLRLLHRSSWTVRRGEHASLAVAAIDGAEITTLEGLGSPEALSPIQTAFHEHYAAQCGFCTSGMVLAAHGYLEGGGSCRARVDPEGARRPRLPLHRLRQDHQRRGGRGRRRDRGHPALVAADERRGAGRDSGGTGMKAVGARLPRYDGVAHVTGRTMYVDDIRVPGTLWAKALRSPVDHADITRPRPLEGRGDEGRPRDHHLEGRPAARVRPPLGARHPGRRAAAREGRRPLQGPAHRGRRGGGRGDRAGRRRGDRPRARGEAGALRRPQGVRRGRAEGAPLGQLVSALRRRDGPAPDPQGLDRRGVRAGGRDRAGRLPARRDRARPGRDAGVPGRARGRRPADDLLLHAGALLLDGRRRRAPAGAAEQAQVRRRHGRRRLRRQGGHRDGDDVRAPRAQVGPAGEVALDARGGVPLLLDAGAVAHGDRGRGDEGRLDPRPQDADAARLGCVRPLLARTA